MSVLSKFVKLDVNILLEYIYNDDNFNGDDYGIVVDTVNDRRTYFTQTNGDNKLKLDNTLFELDNAMNKYSEVSSVTYPFVQVQDYAGTVPIIHDKIRIHLPSSYNFDENLGFYLNAYVFDYTNNKTIDLCQFYYNNTDPDHQRDLLVFASPAQLFGETLYGKYVEFDIPAPRELGKQRDTVTGNAKNNSLNFNLTNGTGISTNNPIFIDFQYLTGTGKFKNTPYYFVGSKKQTTIPLIPESENLGVRIEESVQGDFFEVFGIYDQSLGEFDSFIDRSYSMGHRYVVQYDITLYEENLLGKKQSILITENFNQKIEYRPIIKTSSTTAIIQVEMRLIDQADGSFIYRRASFGMLPEQVAKYSLYLTKINIDGAVKPKIYNIKSKAINLQDLFAKPNKKKTDSLFGNTQVRVEQVKVPYPVLVDKFYVCAKSENSRANNKLFYGNGLLQVIIYPFDNVLQFTIANAIDATRVEFFDLTSATKVDLVFKDTQNEVSAPLYTQSGSIDLKGGSVVFKINSSQIPQLRAIANNGRNLFYIVANISGEKTVIYSGSFVFFDDLENVKAINSEVNNILDNQTNPSDIVTTDAPKEIAIVTRKKVTKTITGTTTA